MGKSRAVRAFSVAAALTATLYLGACTEESKTPTSETPAAASEESDTNPDALPVRQPQDPPSAAAPGPTLRDEFTAMARRVPGGFGGVYLVASHCSDDPFQSYFQWPDPITHYYQPTNNGNTSHHIGNKGIDPPLFNCVEDPDGCRNSDAAQGLYPSYASGELGYLARPASRNDDTYTLDSTDPRFEITGIMQWSIHGETLEKVGRTTGWSGGEVIDGCITIETGDGYTIRCAMIVDARAGTRDSGAPVFRILSGTDVQLRGTLFGAILETCDTGVDPEYSDVVLYCDEFVASNLGGILMDLDPNGWAPLTFH